MGVYDDLGIKRYINAWGPMTVIGGSRMRPEVLKAMVEAGQAFVDLNELQRKAGQRIADLVGVEACYIAGGAAAALAISTAACVAGTDPAKIARLPDTTGMKNEVIMQRLHRNGYDHAVRQVGVKLVEIGSGWGTAEWELEAAITPNTAAILYVYASWTRKRSPSIANVARVAHQHGVPVIVDAAAETPPLRNLRGLNDAGADLVIFSGGKGLMGPQSTGLILGRKDLIAACVPNASPNHSLCRSMKVSKEDMAGIVKAVELYVALDHDAERRRWEQQADLIIQEMQGIPGVKAERGEALYSEGIPVATIKIDPSAAGRSAAEVDAALMAGDPGIRVTQMEDSLIVNPHFLEPGEEEMVAERLKAILGAPIGAASAAAAR